MSNSEIRTKPVLHLRDLDEGCENPHTIGASDHLDYRKLADATNLCGFLSLTC